MSTTKTIRDELIFLAEQAAKRAQELRDALRDAEREVEAIKAIIASKEF